MRSWFCDYLVEGFSIIVIAVSFVGLRPTPFRCSTPEKRPVEFVGYGYVPSGSTVVEVPHDCRIC